MKASLILALLPLALAAPSLEPRADNAAAVLADIKKAQAGAKKFKTDLDAIPDSGPISSSAELKLQNDDQAILTALKNGYSSCSSSSAFTAAQSKQGYAASNALEPLTVAVLNDVVAHKAAFTSAGLTSLVCSDLSDLRTATASLSNCLVSKVTSTYTAKASALAAKFDSDFSSAESSFGC